jgi:hypothetical protein
MTNVTIKQYQYYQDNALQQFPPYVAREFLPLTFHDVQFQSNIQNLNELWKFSDSQQEFRYEQNLRLLNGGLTDLEFEIFRSATEKIVKFNSAMHKPVFGRNALTRSFISLRAIQALAKSLNKEMKDIKILEIGPGSGYLGLILGLMGVGVKYWSTEVAQSLYLYQNHIWNHALEDKVFEYLDIANAPNQNQDEFVHIPWWTWVNYSSKIPNFDILVINHAVNEISPKGFMYLMAKLSANLENLQMIVEGWGGGRYHSNLETLLNYGFSLNHSQHDHHINPKYLPISVGNFKKNVKQEFSVGENVIAIFSKRLAQLYRNRSIQRRFYYSRNINNYSRFFLNPMPTNGIDALESFYEAYGKTVSRWTDDEIFGNYIGSNKHLIRN